MVKFKLSDLNPIVLISILILVSILITFDNMPFLSFSLVILILMVQVIWSKYSLIELLVQLRLVFWVAFIYVFFIWLTRSLTNLAIDYYYLSALFARFLVFSSYSFSLINNTDTKKLTMALMKYFRMSDRIGFSFMAVYKFLPSFREELNQIRYTHAIRGLNKTGLFSGMRNMIQYSIPLLVTAIRKSKRLSVSMENRGLGKYETRTYYQELTFKKTDRIFISAFIILIILLVAVGYYLNLISFFS